MDAPATQRLVSSFALAGLWRQTRPPAEDLTGLALMSSWPTRKSLPRHLAAGMARVGSWTAALPEGRFARISGSSASGGPAG